MDQAIDRYRHTNVFVAHPNAACGIDLRLPHGFVLSILTGVACVILLFPMRFLARPITQLRIVFNWHDELKRLVPTE